MRHLRMSNVQITDLTLKRHIGNYLNELHKNEENKEKKTNVLDLSSTKTIEPSPSRENKETKARSKHKRKFKYTTKSSNKNVKLRQYKCRECTFTVCYKRKLFAHFKVHGYCPKSCKKCRTSFANDTAFDWHLVNNCHPKNANKRFECKECIRVFKSKRYLIRHLEGHKRNNCTYCDKIFTRRRHLVKHLLQQHSIKDKRPEHHCQFCEKSYVKKRNLYVHIKKLHCEGKFVCLDCGKIFENLNEYTEHKEYHESQKQYLCSKCNEKFLRQQQYIDHLKRHNRYKCNTCNKSFASQAKALPHKQLRHDVTGLEPTFVCPLCQKCFYTNFRLSKHVKKHTEAKPTVSCKYCKKTFNTLLAYYRHCMTAVHGKHSPKKPLNPKLLIQQKPEAFECDHCSYVTNNKNNFARHYELHFTTTKNFVCELCGKKFFSLATLQDHISYNHVQDKIYKCEECTKSFKRKSELVRHQGSHSKERPFVCEVCGTSYKRSTHLKRHEKSAHDIAHETKRPSHVVKIKEKSCANKANAQVEEEINNDDLIVDPLTLIQGDGLLLHDENIYCDYNLADNFLDGGANDFGDLNIVDQFVNSAMPTDLSVKGDNLFGGDASLPFGTCHDSLINRHLLEESDREITEYIKTYMQ